MSRRTRCRCGSSGATSTTRRRATSRSPRRADAVQAALAGLAARGITQAVLQPHVEGDLVKFYGIGGNARPDGTPAWFRSFYHKNQTLRGYPLDPVAARPHGAPGGGRAGARGLRRRRHRHPAGRIVLLDLNAWPSFALFREEAAERIAEHLERRFAGAGGPGHERAPRGRTALARDRRPRAEAHRPRLAVLLALLGAGDGARPGLHAHRRGRQRVHRLHRRHRRRARSATAIRTTSRRSSARPSG